MKLRRMRIYTAGLLAFLLGVPLTERAFAQGWDILNSSLGLAGAISNAAGS